MNKLTAIMAAALMTASAADAQADVVGLKTNKTVGETIALTANAGVKAQLVWSNGDTEEIAFDGKPQSITVKADSLALTTTTGSLTRFYINSAGLVNLNVSGATALQKLFCADNSLSTLNLTANTKLSELDCQGNALTALTLRSGTNLTYLNCADNKIADLTYSTPSSLQTLVVSNNTVDTLKYQTNMRSLQTLWAGGNALRVVNLGYSKQLKNIVAPDNKLVKVQLAATPLLTDVWLERNSLTELDLSAASPKLVALSVNDNPALSTILWDKKCASTLRYFYGQNAQLFFNSFPTLSDNLTAVLVPQADYFLTDRIVVDKQQDWSDVLYRNAFGVNLSLQATVTDATGTTLERGASKDYYHVTGKWTFFKMFEGVSITATTARYPDLTFHIKPFDVTDATGIDSAPTTGGLTFAATAGTLTATATKSASVRVYDTAGRCVISADVTAGTHAWPLAAGIYVVNGKKILVPNF